MSALEVAGAEPERDPWERQPGEGARAFAAFQVYRDMGPTERSLRQLVARRIAERKTIHRWSAQNGWVSRSAAYDAMLERARIQQRVSDVQEMESRHAQIAQAGLAALSMPLIALGRPRRVGDSQVVERLAELEAMPTGDLIRLAAHSARSMTRLSQVERTARGDPGEEVTPDEAASSGVEPLPEEERLRDMFFALAEAGLIEVEGTFRVGQLEPDVDAHGLPILEAPAE